jgi:RHS repeat-associated protein
MKRYDPVHAANSELYTYDNMNQIKTLNRGDLNNEHTAVTNINHSESWNFDKTGNWQQYNLNGNVETRTHNAANELQNIAAHDANGNMTLMPNIKGKYDAWNRLIEVRNTNDELIAQYEYNALNQRIKKTVGSVVIQSFFNENWQELESVTNNQVTNYVWGLRYIDDLILREKGNEKLYSIADPNWNVIAICDNTGDIQERYTYNAFGKRNVYNAIFVAQIESAFNWNRAFTGQVLDSETGLMLYRNRYYHVELGRFVSRDPIGYDAGDENLFRYVWNQAPLTYDEYGLQDTLYTRSCDRYYDSPSHIINSCGRNSTSSMNRFAMVFFRLSKICDGLECGCISNKYKCTQEDCLITVARITFAKFYADSQAAGINAFVRSRRNFGGEGRCHLWSRYFAEYLAQYPPLEAHAGCINISTNLVFDLNESKRWQDHNINRITNRATYATLVLDDGFWGHCGDIYNPLDFGENNLPPLLSKEGEQNWLNMLKGIEYERKIRETNNKKCCCDK